MASSRGNVAGHTGKRKKKMQKADELDLVFEQMDLNHDGRISVRELMKAARFIGHNPTQKEAEKMIKDANPAQKGYVTKAEFKRLFSERQADIDDEIEEITKAFRVFDKDGDGSITMDELKYVMSLCGEPMGEEELNQMLQKADVDGDGQISYEEFAAVMCDLG